MKIPEGLTESEVLEAIDRASSALTSLKFGYFDDEDIKQECAVLALIVLGEDKYDPRIGPDGKPTRPLVNFLYTHFRNRVLNLKRDRCRRADPPCLTCHECIPGQTEHDDRQYCPKYAAWLKRNVDKQNILCPMDITEQAGTPAREEVVEEVATDEILRLIDRELPAELRSAYLRMRDGQRLPKAVRDRVEEAVKEIIKETLE